MGIKRSWSVGKILKEVVTFLVMLFLISTAINYIRAPKLDSKKLPDIKGKLIDGSYFDSKSFTKKPLMINFWGTWCPVCKQEAGNIARVSKSYNVLTIAVNSGSDKEIANWLKKEGVEYPVLNDRSGKLASQFRVNLFPTTFIYDSNGKLKFTESGYSTTAGLMARMKLAQ